MKPRPAFCPAPRLALADDREDGADVFLLARSGSSARSPAPPPACAPCVAPGGSVNCSCARPWSSAGRKLVGSTQEHQRQQGHQQHDSASDQPMRRARARAPRPRDSGRPCARSRAESGRRARCSAAVTLAAPRRALRRSGGLQQRGRERRRQHQRDQHRQHHRRDDGDRELAVDHAGRAAEERHRQEHRRQHQRDARSAPSGSRPSTASSPRAAMMPGSSRIRRSTFSTTTIASSTSRPIASTMPNRVSVLMEKPNDRQHAERAEQHHRHRDGRDQRGAPALQEHEHHDDDQHDRLDQRLDHFLDRQLDEVGAVAAGRRIR